MCKTIQLTGISMFIIIIIIVIIIVIIIRIGGYSSSTIIKFMRKWAELLHAHHTYLSH
jgi:hypothetical protein